MSTEKMSGIELEGVKEILFDFENTKFDTVLGESSAIVESLKNLKQVSPEMWEVAFEMASGVASDESLQSLKNLIEPSLDMIDGEILNQFSKELGLIDNSLKIIKALSILQDDSLDQIAKAELLANLGYDMMSEALLNAVPPIKYVINLPIVGEPIKVGFQKGGIIIGDKGGPFFDRIVEDLMDRSGMTDAIKNNKDFLRAFLGFDSWDEYYSNRQPLNINIQSGESLVERSKVLSNLFFK